MFNLLYLFPELYLSLAFLVSYFYIYWLISCINLSSIITLSWWGHGQTGSYPKNTEFRIKPVTLELWESKVTYCIITFIIRILRKEYMMGAHFNSFLKSWVIQYLSLFLWWLLYLMFLTHTLTAFAKCLPVSQTIKSWRPPTKRLADSLFWLKARCC